MTGGSHFTMDSRARTPCRTGYWKLCSCVSASRRVWRASCSTCRQLITLGSYITSVLCREDIVLHPLHYSAES
jgi:hypothetical protein